MSLTVDTTDVDPEGDETVWHDGKVRIVFHPWRFFSVSVQNS